MLSSLTSPAKMLMSLNPQLACSRTKDDCGTAHECVVMHVNVKLRATRVLSNVDHRDIAFTNVYVTPELVCGQCEVHLRK